MQKFYKHVTVRTCLMLAAAVLPATQTQAADLHGHITDAQTHAALPGASVRIHGTRISVTADNNGSFAFHNLKPGHYTLDVDYVGYPDISQSTDVQENQDAGLDFALDNGKLETVVVTGMQRAERVALQTKRVAGNFVDALAANDVGKLPDQNVAEAMRRMPGISVTNDQGEGRYVVIRGVAPNLANVTLNGATAPAPESEGRNVKLDDIPSSLISSLQVIKTLTPDLDANAIAGEVNISTLSAFDRKGTFAFGRMSYGYYNMNGKSPIEGDVTVGGRFGPNDQFGLVVSANYSRRDIESENFGSGGPDWDSYNGYTVPSELQLRNYNLVRKRTGLVANFDWHPNDDTKLYLRTTYSTYSDHETRDRFVLGLSDDEDDYSDQTATTGSFSGASAKRYVRSRNEADHTLNLSLGGETRVVGGELSFEGGYGHAVKTDPRRNEYTFKAKKISGTYDLSSFLYMVTPDEDAYDAENFAINKIEHDHRRSVEDLYQGRGDYEYPVTLLSPEDTLKVGVKYTGRHKSHDETNITFEPTDDATMTLADVSYTGKKTIFNGRYTFGPRVNYKKAEAYVAEVHGDFTCDDSDAGGLECDVDSSISDSLTSDYDVKEGIIAGYAMMTLNIGDLTLIPGVRVEATDGTYKGKTYSEDSSSFDQGFDNIASRSYTNVFPGINAKYIVSDDLQLRAAITTAIGRPDYKDLAPYIIVDTSEPEVEEGNPDLKALTAVNYDAAVEYYLPHQGIISLGAFYKDIDNPIYTQTLTDVSGTFAGHTLSGAKETKPLNAASGKVRGLEINAQMQFDFLPVPLDGFGISANYSYIDSEANGMVDRDDKVPLFDQSKNVASFQLLYEKYGMAARMAYSYRSHFLDTVGSDKATDVYEAAHEELDARLSYQLLESLTVFVEGKNLTDAPWRRYIGDKSHEYENERYGWSMNGGFQFKF